ncbi:MAG: serine hydrolase [Candidatus Magasanikbacteria bacterium]
MFKRILIALFCLLFPVLTLAQSDFNPNFIISDTETQDSNCWTRNDVQQFLTARGSFLRNYTCADASGTTKTAADIIYEAAQTYNINPKFLLVTLQKEQSLVTDDSPSQKQLDWATGYSVCDSCSMDDPNLQKFRGFGKQVDNAAGLIRWYYDNKDNKSYIKKKDAPVMIDNTQVTPDSWATAFLYTYTPHLHGNKNFWRIWETWFGQVYPNGTIFKTASSSEYWMLQDGKLRKFKNTTALITRADPKMAVPISETDLSNYPAGLEISFPNYSLLKTSSSYYLLDYDTLRPFESETTVFKLGFNPQEVIDVTETDLAGYLVGATITASSTAPTGIIYYVPELKEPYYYIKDGVARVIIDKRVVEVNFKKLKVEKRAIKDLRKFTLANDLINFKDGILLKAKEFKSIYVIEDGQARAIADNDTFNALGYKHENIITVPLTTLMALPQGEPLYLNTSLLSKTDKFLGDSEANVDDLFGSKLPVYLIAEYPSGRIISGKNIDTQRPIASIVKILTAYEALNQSFDLKKTTVYKSKLYASEGNPLKFKDGQKISNSDIFASMLVISANTCARIVAQTSGLTTEEGFIHAINNRLADWGADNSKMVEPTGLDPNNVSTARDLLKIFVKILKNDIIKDSLDDVNYKLNTIFSGKTRRTITNTNLLYQQKKLPYKILASKTGYIDESGSNLIILIEDPKTKKQYVIITLGESNYANRFVEPDKMAKWTINQK